MIANMRTMAKQQPKQFRGRVTLCWVCQNCFGGCSWSRDYTPVEGWKAKKTPNSYLVLSCPSFDPGTLLCSKCFRRRDCDYSPFQAGTSRLVADCDRFAPDDLELPHKLDAFEKKQEVQKQEVQKQRGGRRKRAVQQWSKDRSTHIKDFESLFAAAREVGGTITHLTRVCNGERKSTKGFWWCWAYSE